MPETTLQKLIYNLAEVKDVINTEFTEFASTKKDSVVRPDVSVNEFFKQYDELFFQIPPSGSENSHLTLASKSLDYIGLSLEELQAEIDNLREENVSLKNQIITLSQIDIGTIEI
jgi:hypothetical protein